MEVVWWIYFKLIRAHLPDERVMLQVQCWREEVGEKVGDGLEKILTCSHWQQGQ